MKRRNRYRCEMKRTIIWQSHRQKPHHLLYCDGRQRRRETLIWVRGTVICEAQSSIAIDILYRSKSLYTHLHLLHLHPASRHHNLPSLGVSLTRSHSLSLLSVTTGLCISRRCYLWARPSHELQRTHFYVRRLNYSPSVRRVFTVINPGGTHLHLSPSPHRSWTRTRLCDGRRREYT